VGAAGVVKILDNVPMEDMITVEVPLLMPHLSSLLLKIPDEYKPWAAFSIGAIILVGLALFHGWGLHRILLLHKRGERRLRSGRPHLWAASFLFGWAVFLMLVLHIMEIIMWAFALRHLSLIPRVPDAIYFCANAYTTVGFGKVDLGEHWRNISPIIAISGLFSFAWTTSSLVDVVAAHGRLVEQLENERERQMELRRTARKAEREARAKERDAEHAAREQARNRAAGAGFLERRKIRREEKGKEGELRVVVRKEIEDIRRKERSEEEKLGPGGE
jgi:hypothetical protein